MPSGINKVKVGYVTYPVKWSSEVIDDDGNKLYGHVRFLPQEEITVWKGASSLRQQESLLHEIIHVVDNNLELGLRERQVKLLSEGLFGVFKDNPGLVKWLVKGAQGV